MENNLLTQLNSTLYQIKTNIEDNKDFSWYNKFDNTLVPVNIKVTLNKHTDRAILMSMSKKVKGIKLVMKHPNKISMFIT